MLKLLAVGEIAMLAHEHATKLEPAERRRLMELVRRGHGRPSRLSAGERDELSALVAKAEPRLFAYEAAGKLSPVALPDRLRPSREGRADRPSTR